MLSKEELEQKYQQTFGEDIVFDEVTQRGDFLIASQKEEKNRFLRGGGGVENEQNSMTYYIINTKDDSDMKIVISSVKETKGKSKETTLKTFSGNSLTSHLKIHDVYIDTSDNTQISKLLMGGYSEAEYSAYSPQTDKLFSEWFHCDKDYQTLDKRFQKYHKEEIEEIKKDLKILRQFFANFIGSKEDLKIAKEHSSVAQRVGKFCKRLLNKKQDMEIKTRFKDFRDNNRF